MKMTSSLLICGLTLQSSLAAQLPVDPLSLDPKANNLQLRQHPDDQDSPFLFNGDDIRLSASHLDKTMIQKELALLDPDYQFDPEDPKADTQKATAHLEMFMLQKELRHRDPSYLFDPKDPNADSKKAAKYLEMLQLQKELNLQDPSYAFDPRDMREDNIIAAVSRLDSLVVKRQLAHLDPNYSFDINDSAAREEASAYLARLKHKQ